MTKHEVGIVYQKNHRLFIAVDEALLVTGEGGVITEVRPTSKYATVRSISVEELCGKWGINMSQFDALMGNYLTPTKTGVRARAKGPKRPKPDEEEFWRQHRTIKINQPSL